MKLRKQNKGFTLIEIIIVVVILGILAAIALPKVTGNIDKAKAAEAFGILGSLGRKFDNCLALETAGARVPNGSDVANCDDFTALDTADPSNANFTYLLSAGATNFTVTARLKAPGVANTSIQYVFDGTGAAGTTKTCAGSFTKLCK